jgi:antitoxin component YwqK of YwqJK toxin-antitoxin module
MLRLFLVSIFLVANIYGESPPVYEDQLFNLNLDEYFEDDPASQPSNLNSGETKSDDPIGDIKVDYFEDDPNLNHHKKTFHNANGIKKYFYPNGRLKAEISYFNGQKDGMEKIFYPDGKLRSETSYQYGRKDGMEKIFYPDGKLRSETNYRNGRKDGMEKTFYSDGRLRSEMIYRNGRVIQTHYRAY